MSLNFQTQTVLGKGLKLSDATFRQLRDYIQEITGIFFQDSKKYLLEGRIAKRLQVLNLDSFEDYLQLIRYSPRKAQELGPLYEVITINETFFFRNEPQFEAFENTLVPNLIERKGQRTKLRVWSSASSSGEEAHTLAMIYLERLKPKYPGLEFEVVGTDLSPAVLDTAKKGIYRDYAIRNIPKNYFAKYFETIEPGRYKLKDEVRQLARFEQINLTDTARMRAMGTFDIIFCCNVLIYFDLKVKVQVVSNLYNGLARGGFLFIGYAESLHGISSAFTLINFPKTVAYKKE